MARRREEHEHGGGRRAAPCSATPGRGRAWMAVGAADMDGGRLLSDRPHRASSSSSPAGRVELLQLLSERARDPGRPRIDRSGRGSRRRHESGAVAADRHAGGRGLLPQH
ncbi:unnamed protein product [Urochloa humidicola]